MTGNESAALSRGATYSFANLCNLVEISGFHYVEYINFF